MKAESDNLDEFLSHHGDIGAVPLLAIGADVGGWRISGFLGRGGSSEVYCVKHNDSGTSAALKILHRTEQRHIERFAREAKFLEENTSTAFPRIFAKGVFDGRPYIVVELLDPMELPKSDREVAQYLTSVAHGLEWLHVHGLVHRDIKPRNIMSRNGEPVIIDFGLLKEISTAPIAPADQLSIVDGKAVGVGTPRYAAPEQFSGGDATPATDIHALGRLAYECFSGNPPRAWSRIICRATSSIPGERFQLISDFMRAVRHRHYAEFAFAFAGVAALVALSFLVVVLAQKPQFKWPPEDPMGPWPDPDPFPSEWKLCDYSLRLAAPVALDGGRVYRLIGPGELTADISAAADVTLWITNMTLNNTSSVLYPTNRVKYILAGDAYLNFGAMDRSSASLSDFITTPDGADADLNRLGLGSANNDIRFRGPTTRKDLRLLKRDEYFSTRR